jgi:hypothetical protein
MAALALTKSAGGELSDSGGASAQVRRMDALTTPGRSGCLTILQEIPRADRQIATIG